MRAGSIALATLLALAGCLGAGEEPGAEERVTTSLATAGAEGGVAGPSEAVLVADSASDGAAVTFHPYDLAGGRARAPAVLEFAGRFETKDCTVPVWVQGVTDRWQQQDVRELFEAGDVAHVAVWMNYTNTDTSWGDLHLLVSLPGTTVFDTTNRGRERGALVQNWTGQVYWRGDEGDRASLTVACFYGVTPQSIPYTLTIRAEYAENVVPANSPILVRVPAAATRLMVAGVPVGPEPVTSHYRIFGPDDLLVGEYALNSNEAVDVAFIDRPGDYVLVVDHTEGGFVSLGTDAPPDDATLLALDTDFERVAIYTQDVPGPAAATVPFTLPRVPLALLAFPDAAGAEPTFAVGREMVMDIAGPRGNVLHFVLEGFAEAEVAGQNLFAPAGVNFEFDYDHHALAQGDHVATLDARLFRGELDMFWSTYLRPGETGTPAPSIGSGEGTFMLPLGVR